MMYRWTPDMILFMRDASEYGSYNEKLAEAILPCLGQSVHICDAGCGLGYLSLALAPHVNRVTAIDICSAALGVLEESCRRRGVRNVVIRGGAVSELQPAVPYDAMVFCLFGGVDEVLETALRQCHGPVVMIKKNSCAHGISIESPARERNSYWAACRRLRELGVPFSGHELTLELGQPFRSVQDVELFLRTYSRRSEAVSSTFLTARLQETGRDDFPLYLPHRREIGLIKFDVSDVGAMKPLAVSPAITSASLAISNRC